MQVVGAAHTRKLFEKSLIKNFTKVVFCLASCLTFGFAETCVRWPRQNHGAASGGRAALVRVKPDKRPPVLRDGVEAVLRAYLVQTNVLPVLSLFILHYSSFIIHYGLFVGVSVPAIPPPSG
jgi:hypothetical protein